MRNEGVRTVARWRLAFIIKLSCPPPVTVPTMALAKWRRLGMPEDNNIADISAAFGSPFDRPWVSPHVSNRLSAVLRREG